MSYKGVDREEKEGIFLCEIDTKIQWYEACTL